MVIELLYPEICTLYGDNGNILFLKKNLKDVTFITTSLSDKPYFVDNKVDLIYMGPTSEKQQETIIDHLALYKDKIKELIDNGTFFLFTGNAYEILASQIVDNNKKVTKGLNIFDIKVTRDFLNRKNKLFIGDYEDIKVVGFQSQFDFCQSDINGLFKVEHGFGQDKNSPYEGFKVNNFYATTLLGPLLMLNPLFSKKFLNELGLEIKEFEFEEELNEAYKLRLEDFNRAIRLEKK